MLALFAACVVLFFAPAQAQDLDLGIVDQDLILRVGAYQALDVILDKASNSLTECALDQNVNCPKAIALVKSKLHKIYDLVCRTRSVNVPCKQPERFRFSTDLEVVPQLDHLKDFIARQRKAWTDLVNKVVRTGEVEEFPESQLRLDKVIRKVSFWLAPPVRVIFGDGLAEYGSFPGVSDIDLEDEVVRLGILAQTSAIIKSFEGRVEDCFIRPGVVGNCDEALEETLSDMSDMTVVLCLQGYKESCSSSPSLALSSWRDVSIFLPTLQRLADDSAKVVSDYFCYQVFPGFNNQFTLDDNIVTTALINAGSLGLAQSALAVSYLKEFIDLGYVLPTTSKRKRVISCVGAAIGLYVAYKFFSSK